MVYFSESKFMDLLFLHLSCLFIVVFFFFVPSSNARNLISLSHQESVVYQKGLLSFGNKEYKRAMIIFYNLFVNHPEDEAINFYLGRSAFEAGEYETALGAFDRILIKEPDNLRVKLEMARTYFKLGTLEQASILFKDVLASNPPEKVKVNIKKYLDFIEALKKRHFFSGFLSIGVTRDDNVYVSPSRNTINIPAFSDLPVKMDHSKLDTWFPLGIGLGYRYQKPDARWFWQNFLQTYSTRYYDSHDLNVDYFGLTSGIGYRLGKKTQLEVTPEAYYMNLDGKRYSKAFGLSARFSLMPGNSSRASITTLVRKKKFHNNNKRDAVETSITLAHIFKLGDFVIDPAVTGKNEIASDDQYSYKRLRCGLTVSRRIFKKINLSLGYTFEYERYKENDPLFNKNRTDRTHYIVVDVSRNFRFGGDWNLTTGLSNTWEYADSNIPIYEYTRNVTQFYIRFNF